MDPRHHGFGHCGAGETYDILGHQHGIQGRSRHSGEAHVRRRGRFAPARLERRAGWPRAPLFLQAVRARRPAAPQSGRHEAGRRGRDEGTHPGHGAARGHVCEAETMRALGLALVVWMGTAPGPPPFSVVVLPATIRGMMSAVWSENNRHWDELAGENTLTQLLGTGKPTQREYLGCLAGEVTRDTLWVRRLVTAANLKQLQFAVAGSCEDVDQLVGTFHTHPYRADSGGRPVKERGLSPMDLATFAATRDRVAMVMWDLDSLDVAAKAVDGSMRHPASLTVDP